MGVKEDLQDLSPSKALMIGLLIAIVYYFLIFDKGDTYRAQMDTLQGEINQMNERLHQVKQALDNKAEFGKKMETLNREFEEILKFFPPSLDINSIQRDITNRLTDTHNRLGTVRNVDVNKRYEGYFEYGVQLDAVGSYHDLMEFLATVTRMDKVVDFRKMKFEVQSANDEQSNINFTIVLSVFAKDKAPAPKPAGGGG